MPRERALATAVRLLDLGFFRIGGEEYAEDNESYGLATIRREHVHREGEEIVFDFPAKCGQRRIQAIGDAAAIAALETMRRRRGGPEDLLAWKEGRRWRDVRSGDINDYIQDAIGDRVLGQGLPHLERHRARRGGAGRGGGAALRRAAASGRQPRAVKTVAAALGNTPAVCRRSYIDPRVFDRYDGGLTVGGVFKRLPENPADWPEVQRPIEKAVLDLIDRRESPAIERVG